MDSLLMEATIIWNNFMAMELNQQIALGLIILSMFAYSLSASASYTLTRNGVEKKIEKVRNWPGHLVKLSWIVLALYVANLWYAVAFIFAWMFITIKFINILRPILVLAQPTISDREKKKLENSF